MSILSRSHKQYGIQAIFLDSGTGFWEFNCAGFSFALMMWLMVRSSACSSVLQVISGDIDGIVHKHSCCAGFGCWFFSYYVSCGIKCLRFSQRCPTITSYTFLLRQKKSSLSIRDCRTRLARLKSVSTTRGGGDTTIPSPEMASKQSLPGIGLHDPLHGRQACPGFNSSHQGVGQISPREGLFLCRSLPKRGQICDIPAPPQSLNDSKFSGTNSDREIFIFPVQLTTCRIGNLTRLICMRAVKQLKMSVPLAFRQ